MGIPYNTLRDHFKKAQGLMAPPRRTVFDYPMAEYKGIELNDLEGGNNGGSIPIIDTVINHSHHSHSTSSSYNPHDTRRRGRKPALPKLIEYQLKVFIKEMGNVGLTIDRTQLKQVAYKIAIDLNLVEFKATDMWLQAFQVSNPLSFLFVLYFYNSSFFFYSFDRQDMD